MNVNKAIDALPSTAEPDEKEMAKINRFTKRQLKPEEVYVFSLILCDNDIDRENERFTAETIVQLSELFVGKTGIFDHSWSALGQTARIYETQVVRDDKRIICGCEPYTALKAKAYMLRTEGNAELIAQIEGGIKKEVSVGCSVKKQTCSICREDISDPCCGHVPGGEYDGKICCKELSQATDAYEWSFVAVPAQRRAGVTKALDTTSCNSLKELAAKSGREDIILQLSNLEHQASLGREYMQSMRKKTLRLGLMCRCGIDSNRLERILSRLDKADLECIKAAFEKRLERMYPPKGQLSRVTTDINESEFMI